MDSFIVFFISMIKTLIELLQSVTIPFFTVDISLGSILFSCIAISIVVSVFWKGGSV